MEKSPGREAIFIFSSSSLMLVIMSSFILILFVRLVYMLSRYQRAKQDVENKQEPIESFGYT